MRPVAFPGWMPTSSHTALRPLGAMLAAGRLGQGPRPPSVHAGEPKEAQVCRSTALCIRWCSNGSMGTITHFYQRNPGCYTFCQTSKRLFASLAPLLNLRGWTLHEIMQIQDKHPSPNRFSTWIVSSGVWWFLQVWTRVKAMSTSTGTGNVPAALLMWVMPTGNAQEVWSPYKKRANHPHPRDLPFYTVMVKARGKAFLTHAAGTTALTSSISWPDWARQSPPQWWWWQSHRGTRSVTCHLTRSTGRAAGREKGAPALLLPPSPLYNPGSVCRGWQRKGKLLRREEPNSWAVLLGSAEHFSALEFLSFFRNLKILLNQGFDVYLIPCWVDLERWGIRVNPVAR